MQRKLIESINPRLVSEMKPEFCIRMSNNSKAFKSIIELLRDYKWFVIQMSAFWLTPCRLKYPCTVALSDEEDLGTHTVLYAAIVRLFFSLWSVFTLPQIPTDERVEQLRDGALQRALPTPPSAKVASAALLKAAAVLPPPPVPIRPLASSVQAKQHPSPPRVEQQAIAKQLVLPPVPKTVVKPPPVLRASPELPLRASYDPGPVVREAERSLGLGESPARTQTPPKASAGSHRKAPAAAEAVGRSPPSWIAAKRSESPVQQAVASSPPPPPIVVAPSAKGAGSSTPTAPQRSITERQRSSEKLSSYCAFTFSLSRLSHALADSSNRSICRKRYFLLCRSTVSTNGSPSWCVWGGFYTRLSLCVLGLVG